MAKFKNNKNGTTTVTMNNGNTYTVATDKANKVKADGKVSESELKKAGASRVATGTMDKGKNIGGNQGSGKSGGNSGTGNKGGTDVADSASVNKSGASSGSNSQSQSKVNDSLVSDLSKLQTLGATNASDTYKKAVESGYSKAEAGRLACVMGRMSAAATADSKNLYQYGTNQSEVNLFNISVANTLATNTLNTGTYSFNTKTYANVKEELSKSANASKKIQDNINRSLANTEKDSAQYAQLEEMGERMAQVNQATLFVHNRLEDAYNATKSADDAVQRIVMNVTTDSLKITVGKTVAYNSAKADKSRERDSNKWQNYVNAGIVGDSGKTNTSTTKLLSDVNKMGGMNTMSDILTAYDIKNNIESCTSNKDYVIYARNNSLEEVARTLKEKGYTEEQWRKLLDMYYVTNRSGKSKKRSVTDEVYNSFVDYFNNYNTASTTVNTTDALANSDTNNSIMFNNVSGNVVGNFNNLNIKFENIIVSGHKEGSTYYAAPKLEITQGKTYTDVSESAYNKMKYIIAHEAGDTNADRFALASALLNACEYWGTQGYSTLDAQLDKFIAFNQKHVENGDSLGYQASNADNRMLNETTNVLDYVLASGVRAFDQNTIGWNGGQYDANGVLVNKYLKWDDWAK